MSAEPMLAAVVIARNEEAYIDRCLTSVLGGVAAFPGTEVVFVDSRSNDRTVAIARTHPVRIVHLRALLLSPAMGRWVGEALTESKYVLFVDGDTEIDPRWALDGVAYLEAHPQVGGVCGRLRELHLEGDRILGETPDLFATGAAPEPTEDPGGNALYRRSVLRAVGSFNPLLASYEETDLAVRLQSAGANVVRLPIPLGTHRTGVRGSMKELRRRLRDNLIRGYGQVLRRSLGTPYFWGHVRRMRRYLQFIAMVFVGLAALATSIALGSGRLVGVWLAVATMLFAVLSVKRGGPRGAALLLADWGTWSVPLILGFLERPRDARTLRVGDVIERIDEPQMGRFERRG